MAKTVGIDLGTTNSCVAFAEGTDGKVLQNFQGYRTTPSMIALNPSGKVLVGHLAKRQAITNPLNTISAAKRLIGRRFDSAEVKHAMAHSAYKIICGPHDDPRVTLGTKDYAPQEVSALVLGEIQHFASEALGEEVTKAIITVPAYFNDNQRHATKDAGRIAGLEVLRVLNEPTAACIAYGLGRRRNETVCVFDFGGGTFDISVIQITDSVFEVLATSGDSYLGGEDIDSAIVDYLVDYGKKQYKTDLHENPLALQRVKLAAEEAKKNLSFQLQETILLPFLTAGADGHPINFEISLTREDLEGIALSYVDRAIDICAQTLEASGLQRGEIDNVLLVGGQTRMPLIQRRVESFFGQPPRKGINPDEVVAVGAAIEAAVLEDDDHDILLLDVTPLDLGIATQGDVFTTLIEKNTRVPVKRGHIFTTVHDNQSTVKLQVFQGDGDRASANELLGEFSLTGIRPALRGEPRIEVMFSISAEGIVSVSAKDLDTGTEQRIEVASTNQLGEEEVRDLIEQNKEYAVDLAE